MKKFSQDDVNALIESSLVFLQWTIAVGFIFNLTIGLVIIGVLGINSYASFFTLSVVASPLLIAISLHKTEQSHKFQNAFQLISRSNWSVKKTKLMWAVSILSRAFIIQVVFGFTLVPLLTSLGIGDPPSTMILSMASIWMAFYWFAFQSFPFEPTIELVGESKDG